VDAKDPYISNAVAVAFLTIYTVLVSEASEKASAVVSPNPAKSTPDAQWIDVAVTSITVVTDDIAKTTVEARLIKTPCDSIAIVNSSYIKIIIIFYAVE
jgi:hypothetical protein